MTPDLAMAGSPRRIDRRDLAASVLQVTGAFDLISLVMNSRRLRGPMVRAVNYHETPERDRESFRAHVRYYVRHMTVLGEADLGRFLRGELPLDRPGLLLTFDDGFKNNHTVAADVLDEFGVKGFFFVSAGFMETAGRIEAARDFVRDCLYPSSPAPQWPVADYQPMSWDDLSDLIRRGHVVGCHGMRHSALGPSADDVSLQREIVDAKSVIEQKLRVPVTSFCWPFGTLSSYSQSAFELIRRHYQYAFTTFGSPLFVGDSPYAIDRISLGPEMAIPRVRWAVHGLGELYFRRRRQRFQTIVAGGD